MNNINPVSLPIAISFEYAEWRNYFFFADFSEHHDLLSKMQVGVLSDENKFLLATILAEVDTGPGSGKWVDNSDSTSWNLDDVEVIYAGKNTNRLPTKSGHQFALGLRFPGKSEAPMGDLYLTFSNRE